VANRLRYLGNVCGAIDKARQAKRQVNRYANGSGDNGYTNNRRADDGYDSEKRMAVNGQYVDERLSWGPMAAHIPGTPGDHYYEERRTSRAQRTSGPAPKYYEYENERV
jgi:hypothetical protein